MDQDRHVERAVPRAREQVALAALLAAFVAGAACASKDTGTPRDPTGVAPPPTATSGAIVQIDVAPSKTSPTARTIFAMSDIHGGYDRMVGLLVGGGLVSAPPASPSALAWTGGNAIVVVAGDLIDKGPQPIEVIDGLRALETSAKTSGGEVLVLLGNHEAEFFVNPTNTKANGSDGIDRELASLMIDPNAFVTPANPRGAWLLARPFAARVGDWFFSHGGSTQGRTLDQLDALFRSELAAHPTFDSPAIVGDDSILEARAWYDDLAVVPRNAQALGVAHIVFGHDPNAIGARGAIAVAQNDMLMRIDCGMSPDVNDSTGCLLRIRRERGMEVAEEVRADRSSRELFRSAPSR